MAKADKKKKQRRKNPAKHSNRIERALGASTMRKSSRRRRSPSNMTERRKHQRIVMRNFWVTEFNGEHKFVVSVRDLSESGIFLNGRMKTSSNHSILRLPSKSLASTVLELTAAPLYDRLSDASYGTAYEFKNMTIAQSKALRNLIAASRRS